MDNENIIFAISGKLMSGKDTVAMMIAARLGKDYMIFKQAFAYKIKLIVGMLTGEQMTEIAGTGYHNVVADYTQEQKQKHFPQWNMTLGTMLQKIGTEVMRDNFDSDVWAKALMQDLTTTNTEGSPKIIHIVTDLRFQNEASYMKRFNEAVLIRINRDIDRSGTGRDINHISETDLDNYDGFDHTINNSNFSLDDLRDEVDSILIGYGLMRN